MQCHYDVLGVSVRATDDELKKAYRKMALQWHPDKNLERLEEAKQKFQLIQAAYDTLSDPQERAFYDRNKDSILRGKATESDGKPETLDLFKYFTTQCYSGFNDTEKGFYTVYRQVFEKIACMDMQYMNDEEEEIVIPNFGQSDSSHEDVAQFYGYWKSYCSSMDFRWAEKYDIREAQGMGRWVERKIEKDNSKARLKARREFNEEVRMLVTFVCKRDKRWLARKKAMEEKIAENARKQEEFQRRRREEREERMKEDLEKEKANLAEYEKELEMLEGKFSEEWGLAESEESDYLEGEEDGSVDDKVEGEGNQEEDLSFLNELYCVACNKNFRTEKSMESHNRSKKHKENVEALTATMTAEEKLFMEKSLNIDSTKNDLPPQERSSKKKKKRNKKNASTDDPEASPPLPNLSEDLCGTKDVDNNPSSLNPDENDIEVDESENILIKDKDVTSSKDESDDKKSKSKLKGKKAKDSRKKGQENQATENDVKVNRCMECGKVYPSKNKLFSHIKSEGHAALKTIEGREQKGREKGKRK